MVSRYVSYSRRAAWLGGMLLGLSSAVVAQGLTPTTPAKLYVRFGGEVVAIEYPYPRTEQALVGAKGNVSVQKSVVSKLKSDSTAAAQPIAGNVARERFHLSVPERYTPAAKRDNESASASGSPGR